MSNNKNISEQTRTTARGVKTKGNPRPAQQPNATRTTPDIIQKMKMAKKVGPKRGQLPNPKVEVSHTVYHDMGMLMAESLGLVSEEVKQMEPVGDWNKPGEQSAKAQKKRAAETPEQKKARLAAAEKLRAQNKENMGSGIISSKVSSSNNSGTP
jgi:hypothetical protein